MDSFLGQVADALYKRFESNLSQCCLVFPGRRAGLFFMHELAQRVNAPIWQPNALGMSQVVEILSGAQASDTLSLLAELYNTYVAVVKTDTTFDAFYDLGNLLLRDFDTIDKYLVDPHQLFRNIKELKDIEQDYSFLSETQINCIRSFWESFHERPDHHLNAGFISLWEHLPNVYDRFNQSLRAKGMAYEGMLYRQMAQLLTDPASRGDAFAPFSAYSHLVFIGFNALNQCEKKLFSTLKNAGKALFYWDYDPYYTAPSQSVQEAGLFMRDNLLHFPPPEGARPTHSAFETDKEMEILSVPSYVLQAKTVPQILARRHFPADTSTALVLADEALLLPLLYAIAPADESPTLSINVTMGYPLQQTTLFNLVETLLHLYRTPSAEGWYYKDVLPLLLHPYLRLVDGAGCAALQKTWIRNNQIRITAHDALSVPLLAQLLEVPQTYLDIQKSLLALFEALEQSPDVLHSDKLLTPVLRESTKQLNKLVLSVQLIPSPIPIGLFIRLFLTHLTQVRIPFSGEPLEGLQVMGILETRCLDFDNVVLLSAQEGYLPSTSQDDSLIPYQLKKAFGLPAPEQQIAMQAYYFYRLMQHAKKVTFVYNSQTEGVAHGEISRFVRQLAFEFHPIPLSKLSYQLALPAITPLVVPKTGEVMQQLLQLKNPNTPKPLSPSALKVYLTCSLRFYFQYVACINPPKEISDELDASQFGNTVHKVLEQLYRPYEKQVLTKEKLLGMIQDKTRLRQVIEEALLSKTGRWLLVADVVAIYVESFIKQDALRAPYTLEGIEYPFTCTYDGVPFKGIIDRIDSRGADLYISDYKTGKEKNNFNSIEGLFSQDPKEMNHNVLQVLFYAFLYPTHHPNAPIPIPRLFFLKHLASEEDNGMIYMGKEAFTDIAPYKETFLQQVSDLITNLFNPDLPFMQAGLPEDCAYCPYSAICQRNTPNQ